MHHKIQRYTFAILCCFGLIMAGCTSSQHSTNGEGYSKTANGSIVSVTEDEYHIHMPTAFPAGVVTFHIANNGMHNHNFKIKGMGVEQQLPADILPGMTADMTVSLVPGVYDVICPILGHADLGMRLSVTATQ
jgi:iron uptake system EfeUOB component EfeO/EfeM